MYPVNGPTYDLTQ